MIEYARSTFKHHGIMARLSNNLLYCFIIGLKRVAHISEQFQGEDDFANLYSNTRKRILSARSVILVNGASAYAAEWGGEC